MGTAVAGAVLVVVWKMESNVALGVCTAAIALEKPPCRG
jgi:hypothetical protein